VTTTPVERERVRALYEDYAHLLNAGELEEWLQLFAEDCSYRVVSRENRERGLPLALVRCDSRAMLSDRIAAIRNTQFFVPRVMRHFVSGVRVTAAASAMGLEATASFLVIESLEHEPPRVHSVGEYRDRLVERGGELRFAEKCAIYDSPVVQTSLIYPL
jgi:anthranilate 1,2-dioxygenase small subunit